MGYKKRIRAFLLSICVMASMLSMTAQAATGSISISGASGNVGSTVTITCTIRCNSGAIGTADAVLVYDPLAIQYISGTGGYSLTGGAGSVVYHGLTGDGASTSLSFSMNFKILKEGSHKVSSSTITVISLAEEGVTVGSATGTITGKSVTTNNNSGGTTNNNAQQDTRDNNSKLSSLQVSPGALAPAFDVGTTSYTVTVPEDTTEVTIAATAQSNKATVSVSGGKDLKLGANEAKVVVTAENGSTSVYTLTIMCGEQKKIQVNGTDNTINESFTDEQIPVGFVREKVTYDDRQYEALKHEKGELYLVNLQNDETGAEFYIYNQKAQEFYHYVQVGFQNGRYIIPLWLDNTREFKQCEMITLTLQDKQFDAWKIDEEYSVIRVMNSDGEITFYQYDNIDGTLQRYGKPVAKEVEETEEKEGKILSLLKEYHLYIIASLGVLVLILMVVLIYFIATRKHRHQARRRKMQKKLEKQKEE